MKLKSGTIAPSRAFMEFGLPECMVTDRAPELNDGEWTKEIKGHHVTQDYRNSVTVAEAAHENAKTPTTFLSR
jgi:hypothetical protein